MKNDTVIKEKGFVGSSSKIPISQTQSNTDSMSSSNNRSSTITIIEDIIKKKYNTLILKLHLQDDKKKEHKEKIRNMSDDERDQFISELLNELKTDLFTTLDNIRQRLKSQRPTDLNDPDYEAKIKLYCELLNTVSSILEEVNKSVKEIFDEFHLFLDELWNAIYEEKNTDEIIENFKRTLDHHMKTKWENVFNTVDEIIRQETGIKQQQQQQQQLPELLEQEHEENKGIIISRSSFAELRPPFVVPKAALAHRICVCIYHENVNLLLKAIDKFVKGNVFSSLQQFTRTLVCNTANQECMFLTCPLCEIDEAVELLKSKVKYFLFHGYVKREQSKYSEQLKSEVTDEKVVIQVDLAENFGLNEQDEIQSAHWNIKTLSTFTAYV
ncbi:unnamed protein product [Didymodactylos carnosus]|uniref:Uncharacterized protein n=1 Tax=Didymodactylos carnosus TaxID=1234261 RepID=A0A814QAX2_9BILA|nr:unnamed protein product [Didymodactylos carnosus]CAF1117384.1 unnamed protein product [Didymodactylos carnosus]CAF3649896.1 unnamed protein product [Didymodactylos carnosus]CAF3881207.1 unnamed protein product [Didymodactylos carnosus]